VCISSALSKRAMNDSRLTRARDVPLLMRELAAIPDLGLLIIDPVVSAVAGDAHKSKRRCVEHCSRCRIWLPPPARPSWAISHFSKAPPAAIPSSE